MKTHRINAPLIATFALAIAAGQASATSIYGTLGNFDVVNDTGHETEGFEIELDGISSTDIYRTFDAPYIRYGTPTLTNFNNGTTSGVYVRYQSPWDPNTHTFTQVTPIAAPGYVPRYDSCWTGGLGASYAGSGCEHFGISSTKQATATKYQWLDGDAATGTFTPLGGISPTPLPAPVWNVQPAAPGAQPVVQAEINIPNPEGLAYGDAYWVKVFKTEVDHPIDLNNLLLDDPLMAGAATEVEWELLQVKPGVPDVALNEGALGVGNQAVLRRYEFYKYNKDWGLSNYYNDAGSMTSYVDPANGEVTACVVDGCNAPTADELGNFVGRQMAGINLAPVPVPATLYLMLSGLGLLGGYAKRGQIRHG